MTRGFARPGADAVLEAEVARFLAWEALLLDEGRFAEWLDLLTSDISYVVVTRPPIAVTPGRWLAQLDEDRRSLEQRVARMADGTAWAEVPPSLTQRLVTNVLVEATDGDAGAAGADLRVHSALLVHRVRLEQEVETFAGRRLDVVRRTPTGLRLARRRVTLAANALPGKNLSIFL